MSVRKTYPFIRLDTDSSDFQSLLQNEWIITNSLGGYSCLNLAGQNTHRHQGVLVSGCRNQNRMLYLQSILAEIDFGNGCLSLTGQDPNGNFPLRFFEYNYDSVVFGYRVKGVSVKLLLKPASDRNAVVFDYAIENNSDKDITFKLRPLLNARSPERINGRHENRYAPTFFTEKIIGLKAVNGYVAFSSEKGAFEQTIPDVYPLNYESESASETASTPVVFSLPVLAEKKEKNRMIAVAYPTEDETARIFKSILSGYSGRKKIISAGKGASIFSLLNAADSFIIPVGAKKTILAGYPYLGELGRDAMISMPGLLFITDRLYDAEKVFERFLNNANHMGVPSGFYQGKPFYGDIDTSLWLIDRLYQYFKLVPEASAKGLLHTYWWVLKDIMKSCLKIEKDGLLVHDTGTWMRNKKRKNAVEVQALWYNALRIMEYFSGIMEDAEGELFASAATRAESVFMQTYWNGKYLNDAQDDDSLSPNQLIALYLDFGLVDEASAKSIMDLVETELLTPVGLRTLSPQSPNYVASFADDPDNFRYCGAVWPWLLGTFISVHSKLHQNRLKARKILEPIIEKHLHMGAISMLPEVVEGNAPYASYGSIAYACSVGEVLRCYFDDIMTNPNLTKAWMIQKH